MVWALDRWEGLNGAGVSVGNGDMSGVSKSANRKNNPVTIDVLK